MRGTGLKTWSPKKRSRWPERSPSSAIDREDVVVARSAPDAASPNSASRLAFASRSSAIASTTMSQPASCRGSVVTLTLPAIAPSSFSAAA